MQWQYNSRYPHHITTGHSRLSYFQLHEIVEVLIENIDHYHELYLGQIMSAMDGGKVKAPTYLWPVNIEMISAGLPVVSLAELDIIY